ncbi:MAG: polysaccharide biosynthesis/export family protein [Steroidobacteraceae bacterium]
MSNRYPAVAWLFLLFASTVVHGTEKEIYRIQPGDVLMVSVWKESDLQSEVLVRSDGGISFPLAGELEAAGHTVEDVRTAISKRIREYVPDAVVAVAIKEIGGNRIYVIGKVNRPGEFMFRGPIDVMQALSLAGGATSFAAVSDIHILRRENGGQQQAIAFHFPEVESGRKLEQNILLRSGDTVVVP